VQLVLRDRKGYRVMMVHKEFQVLRDRWDLQEDLYPLEVIRIKF
jgi:hypothetical protein